MKDKIPLNINQHTQMMIDHDPVLKAFSKICAESWIIFYRRPDYHDFLDSPRFHGTSAATREEFKNAIVADPAISKIFPDTSNAEKVSYMIYTSCGDGSTIQIWSFVERLLQNSHVRMLLYDKSWAEVLLSMTKNLPGDCVQVNPHIIIDLLLLSAQNILNVMRDAINGKNTKASVLLYFLGAGIDKGIQQSKGIFIPFHAGMKFIFPPEFHPIEYCYVENAGFVYEAYIDYKIKIDCDEEDDDNDIMQWRKKNYSKGFIKNMADAMPFACAMCSEKDNPVSVHWKATINLHPFAPGGSSFNSHIHSILSPTILNAEKVKGLLPWIEKISQADDSKIEIAKRRLRSALLEAYNPEDSFIDCIIGLENLFGERSEIAFTLATCISRLLHDDIKSREEKFAEIKKLYTKRSAILHGKKSIPPDEMKKHRDQALDLLRDCLKKLYEDRNDLMALDTADRARKIALE